MRRALEVVGSMVLFTIMTACADPTAPAPPGSIAPPPPPAAVTTKAYLAEPRTFNVASSSTAHVTASGAGSGDTAALSLVGGTITLQADDDGNLAILALDVDVGDIDLPVSATLPDGLDLMGVKLSLPAIADVAADWSGDASTMNAQAKTDSRPRLGAPQQVGHRGASRDAAHHERPVRPRGHAGRERQAQRRFSREP